MKLREMEIFHAIVHCGSVTEAARRLGVSQPAVSAALKHAEDQLGMALFRRVRGRLEPTSEALDLFPEVETLFQKLDAIRRLAENLRDMQSGLLSVASTPTLSYAYVCPATDRFRAQRPNVRLFLGTTNTRQIVQQAQTRQIDLGVIANPLNTDELESEVFATGELLVLLHDSHPLTGRETLRPSDLADWPLITNTQHSMFHRLESAFRQDGVTLRVAIACNHHMTTCLLLGDGRTIAVVDPWMPREMLPGLVRRPLRPRLRIQARLIWPRSRNLSRVAEAFRDELRSLVREGSVATGDQGG